MSYKIYTAGQLQELSEPNVEAKLFRSPTERFWVNMANKEHSEKLASEMHDHEADIYVVLEGEGEIYLGGTLVNPTSPRPGQHRGTGLDGATHHHMTAGDLIIIPEGVPHMVDTRNSRMVFLIIKHDTAA
ncbi:MAG: cupin domain-containing protein [Armatimonadota bacterium]